MKSTIFPVGNRVLIKPKDKEEKTKSGLLLSGDEEKQDTGEIMAVGDGKMVQRFKKGDVLIYQRYGPAEVNINKEKFVICHIDEFLGRIK